MVIRRFLLWTALGSLCLEATASFAGFSKMTPRFQQQQQQSQQQRRNQRRALVVASGLAKKKVSRRRRCAAHLLKFGISWQFPHTLSRNARKKVHLRGLAVRLSCSTPCASNACLTLAWSPRMCASASAQGGEESCCRTCKILSCISFYWRVSPKN